SYLGTLTITEGGLWGSLAAVSVNIVAVFVIFGAVLNAGEAGQGFMNIAAAAAGRLRGGAAKVAVVSSALFGSISGSASANVASRRHASRHDPARLPPRARRRHRGGGLLGRPDHAAPDGRRRLRDGRADRRALHLDHGGRLPSGAPVLLRGMGRHQRVLPALR